MSDLGTSDHMVVLTRALGMLDAALAGKRSGRRIGIYDPESQRFSDLVI